MSQQSKRITTERKDSINNGFLCTLERTRRARKFLNHTHIIFVHENFQNPFVPIHLWYQYAHEYSVLFFFFAPISIQCDIIVGIAKSCVQHSYAYVLKSFSSFLLESLWRFYNCMRPRHVCHFCFLKNCSTAFVVQWTNIEHSWRIEIRWYSIVFANQNFATNLNNIETCNRVKI